MSVSALARRRRRHSASARPANCLDKATPLNWETNDRSITGHEHYTDEYDCEGYR